MSGAFAEWQPRYAAHGVATFPVTPDKVPAVKGYLRVGQKGSEQLAIKFAANDAFGVACKRNRLTILDVDTNDERVLADAMSRHGQSPFIVRSGSGNYQAWYRHNGERRRVRPVPSLPIDILGDGFVVAPPSLGSKGRYEIIEGRLDDLDRLPRMSNVTAGVTKSLKDQVYDDASAMRTQCVGLDFAPETSLHAMKINGLQAGDGRNDALFRRCLRAAYKAGTKDELMQIAAQANGEFAHPLGGSEVGKVASSAWRYKEAGRLFVPGGEATAVVFHSDLEHLWDKPVAMTLLLRLRMAHGWRNGQPFVLARETAQLIGVSYPTYLDARSALVSRHFIEIVHPGGKGKKDPPLARLI